MHLRRAILIAAASAALRAPGGEVPGPRPDGSVVLHNQWAIHPAGLQVPLGDFPVGCALDPAGRRAAVIHAGYGRHEVRLIDLRSGKTVGGAAIHEAFCGIAFTSDGKRLYCSGGSDGVLHAFAVSDSGLESLADVRVTSDEESVVAGFALSRDGRSAVVALAYDNRLVRVDLASGRVLWTARLGGRGSGPRHSKDPGAPNAVLGGEVLVDDSDPLNVAWDEKGGRVYATLWGESSVAVVEAETGALVGDWQTGLHPNELLVSGDGRLFVANGGLNSVAVLDARTGRRLETLCSAGSPGEPPGSTPDSLALSGAGDRLFIANAYTNTVAVFDVSVPGAGRPLGFIPTGWFPTSVRVSPDSGMLVVVSARGLEAKPSSARGVKRVPIASLYPGSLGILPLPGGDAFGKALSEWTVQAQRCWPHAAADAEPGNPIPAAGAGGSPIRYVVYVVKENRTYDQVLGDDPRGNGDPSLCMFPERVTPNIHAIARQFVLLDNFYANAEISASGHEWSMAGYSSEFVEKSWPVNYGHGSSHVPYPAEGHYVAAVPALGYLWDRAASAGVSYRSYGEFTVEPRALGLPIFSNMPALKGHVDPAYQGWMIDYKDCDRAREFIRELRRFEAQGDMPRLQILRLPQDHTAGARKGSWTPEAMVADNDEAVGRILDALSHSRFWPELALFVVEDDAQNGPDHVDAHRTEALVAGPFVRHGFVDSTPYTTCSMLRTIELILGLEPMSQFDASAAPMRGSFQAKAGLTPFALVPEHVDTDARNTKSGREAAISAKFDLTAADRIDEGTFNSVLWHMLKGDAAEPSPVRAAFVRALPLEDDDD